MITFFFGHMLHHIRDRKSESKSCLPYKVTCFTLFQRNILGVHKKHDTLKCIPSWILLLLAVGVGEQRFYLLHLSLRVKSIMVSVISQMLHPDLKTFRGLNISDPHHLVAYISSQRTLKEIFWSDGCYFIIFIVIRCVAICFRLCWRQSDDLFVCFSTKPTQRAEFEISREAVVEEKGRSQRVRESWQRMAEENNRLEIAVQGRTQSAEGRLWEDRDRAEKRANRSQKNDC